MTKRYPLRGAFCGGDSGNARDFQGIAFGVLEAADGGYDAGFHRHEGVGFGGAGGHPLGGGVDHLHFPAFAIVRALWHGPTLPGKTARINTESTEVTEKRSQITSFRSRIGTVSPALTCPRSAGTTRKQFACANAATSPDPCQGKAFTSAVAPRHSTRAGRKWVSPGFSFSAAPRRASTRGKSRAGAPLSRSIAGTTNNSNVTMVETGLPGSPKTKVSPHFPNTAGFPGRIATASKWNCAPRSLSTVSTRSYLPIVTPPERTSACSFRPRSILACKSSTRSAALPSRTGSPPARRTCAASETPLLLRI